MLPLGHSHCHCYYHYPFALHVEKRISIFGVYFSFLESVLYFHGCSVVSTETCWLHSCVNQEKERWESLGLPPARHLHGRGWVLQLQNSMLGINGNWGVINSQILISVTLAARWSNSTELTVYLWIYVSVSGGSICLHICTHTHCLPQLSRNKVFT